MDKNIRVMLVEAIGEKVVADRRISLFTDTSYGDDKYRIWFFHLEGSPTMAFGYIEKHWGGFKMTVENYGTKKVKYFDNDFKKSTAMKVVA